MPRRKKGAVRKAQGYGARCDICGLNCGKGGALKKHVEGEHKVQYEDYKKCFRKTGRILINTWDESVKTPSGRIVSTNVLVRRVIRKRNN